MKLGKIILNNVLLKTAALILAILTWFYVVNIIEDTTDKQTILAKILPSYSKYITKKLSVEAVFAGTLPDEYKISMADVKIEPDTFLVAGPKYILNKVKKLQTVPIDISKYRKTATCEAQIAPIAQNIDTDKLEVKVIIPIKKISENNQQGE